MSVLFLLRLFLFFIFGTIGILKFSVCTTSNNVQINLELSAEDGEEDERYNVEKSIDGNVGDECTYFAGARNSKQESSLVNCSWYKDNACCKRTEVTSVFGGMPPLHLASKTCRNMMNYLMCFFCSPYQNHWYRKAKAVICADFCRDILSNCKDAYYNGISLGSQYKQGEDFCRAQNFDVLQGEHNCFAYDPTVFGRAAGLPGGPLGWFSGIVVVLVGQLSRTLDSVG